MIFLYLLTFFACVMLIVLGVKVLSHKAKVANGKLPKGSQLKVPVFELIVCSVLVTYSIILLGLFVWALLTSFKGGEDFLFNPLGLPEVFTFDNYKAVFEAIAVKSTTTDSTYSIWDQFGNAVIYSAGSAFFRVAATTIVAYCTAKYKHWLSTLIYNVVLVTLALPIVGNMPSMLQVTSALGIFDTFQGMFIMNFAFNNIYFLIIHAAFKNISWTYAEAAFIDGASHARIFVKIYLPMVLNLVGAVFLLFFIELWNEYQTPMVYLPSYPTISYGLFTIANGGQTGSMIIEPPLVIATGVFAFAIIFVLFIVFREKLMGNLTEGGIKG